MKYTKIFNDKYLKIAKLINENLHIMMNRTRGIMTHTLDAYTLKIASPNIVNAFAEKVPNEYPTSISKIVKSLESLFKILPKGILSKNSFNGANNKLTIIDL